MLIHLISGAQLLLQDVHHGNGTQEIFDGDNSVSYHLPFVLLIALQSFTILPYAWPPIDLLSLSPYFLHG